MFRAAAILSLALIAHAAGAACAQRTLHGTVVDERTNEPVPFVTVVLDSARSVLSSSEGLFDFGRVPDGDHVLIFDHIAYTRHVVRVAWPGADVPLLVHLTPSQFTMDKIVVTERRVRPAVGAVTLDRQATITVPGNIANDPLRTVQSQPSCASDGVDFLSKTAVRGGDTEEHRVYFDGYHLRHYAHTGGFTGVIYDDMIERAQLVPGAAPIRYTGNLSGVVALSPVKTDTSLITARYDITSMAGGISQELNSWLSLQASGKSSYVKLPVYQEVGVKNRSFRDAMVRLKASPRPSVDVTTTLIGARDTEEASWPRSGAKRRVQSLVAGVRASYREAGWELSLRPSYSHYDSRDAILFFDTERSHELKEADVRAEVSRSGRGLGISLSGEVGSIRHQGSGGSLEDTRYSASAEVTLARKRVVELVAGAGGSREPWTSDLEPEAYGSLKIHLGPWASLGAGYRRSHQSPFLFSERRYFASVPIDPGDLAAAYTPGWEHAPAVRMDQGVAEATVHLPLKFSATYSGFQREYENLLAWEWEDFPGVARATSGGDGHGFGHEIMLSRDDPEFLSLMVAVSRARVWKREGTLDDERVGDFDRPASWQAGVTAKLSRHVRLSLRWMDTDGRPFTSYNRRAEPPSTRQVNASRLRRFQRLDLKVVYSILDKDFDGEIFVDVLNLLDRRNIALQYVVEVAPGEFVSAPYGGTKLFPIGGVTVRW